MYFCVRGIVFASFCELFIEFWNFSDSWVVSVFHLIYKKKLQIWCLGILWYWKQIQITIFVSSISHIEKKHVFPLAFSFQCSQHNPINPENMQGNLINTYDICHITYGSASLLYYSWNWFDYLHKPIPINTLCQFCHCVRQYGTKETRMSQYFSLNQLRQIL
jgi:hypothetical protein